MLNGCEWFVCWFMNRFDFENVIIISTIPIAVKFQQLIYSDLYNIYIYYMYKPPFLRGTLRHPRRQGLPRTGKKWEGDGFFRNNGHGFFRRAVRSLAIVVIELQDKGKWGQLNGSPCQRKISFVMFFIDMKWTYSGIMCSSRVFQWCSRTFQRALQNQTASPRRICWPNLSGLWISSKRSRYTGKVIDTLYHYLVGGDWNHGILLFHSVGNAIIPTDFHSIIFQRGWNQPPTSYETWKIDQTVPKKCFNHWGKVGLSTSKRICWSQLFVQSRVLWLKSCLNPNWCSLLDCFQG